MTIAPRELLLKGGRNAEGSGAHCGSRGRCQRPGLNAVCVGTGRKMHQQGQTKS